jgi:diguanylate cyclase (GGDEF)-like protein/PAS domain S-box-containing protein
VRPLAHYAAWGAPWLREAAETSPDGELPMQAAPHRENEAESLAALRRLEVLDTAAEPEFDALVRAASLACATPIGLITLIDAERQWFKASVGLQDTPETPRTLSFCAHAVLGDALLEVADAALDPRFADNPLVINTPHIRFYAGAPIRLGDGARVGTLCVIDRVPRHLAPEQREILQCLARVAARALEGRRAIRRNQHAAAEAARAALFGQHASDGSGAATAGPAPADDGRALQDANERVALATESGGIGIWDWDVATGVAYWSHWMYRLFGIPELDTGETSYAGWRQGVHPEDLGAAEQALQDAIRGVRPFDTEFRVIWPDASIHHLRATARVTRDANGRAVRVVGANWDITEPRRLAAELAAQHELLRVTLQSIGDAVITTDSHGRVAWMNPVAEEMTGWVSGAAQGCPLEQVFRLLEAETRFPAESPVAQCLATGHVVELATQSVLISRDGREFGIEDSAAPIRNAHGEILGVVLVFHDVTEQRRLSGEMGYRATHDALTGLINRHEFENRLRRLLKRAREDHSTHALMYIDLDQFKVVNDTCGHAVGDQLLQQVAQLMGEGVRTRDTLARLGGDEFAIILEHCTVEQALRVGQQICQRMTEFRFNYDEERFRIGTSIGLVPVDSRWADESALLQAADTSCYAAKAAGRNRVNLWFDSDLEMRARHRETQWAGRIEHALNDNRFVLFGQRIVSLDGAMSGLHAEILLRLVDGGQALILPGAFLPAAERFHLAARIDPWVVTQTLAWLRGLPRLDGIDLISVNLSGQSLCDQAFHRWLGEVLLAAGSAICARLCFEITEITALANLADATALIELLHRLGVRVAIDDFGAGSASGAYLKALPVDFIKIDGQFIRDLVEDPRNEAAVRSFAQSARDAGIRTVAEFVDRPAVMERLRAIGIDFAQGYLLHQPVAVEKLPV